MESTHQTVLKILLEQPAFLKSIAALDLPSGYVVQSEPLGKLFDLGVKASDGSYCCVFELKMWSRLSEGQLKKQVDYVKGKSLKCFHLLLGTSGIEYYKDGQIDELYHRSGQVSQKIGYPELISSLRDFIVYGNSADPVIGIAGEYMAALERQSSNIENAWLSENDWLRHYSLYSQMRKYMKDGRFTVYQVDNPSGGATIFNNQFSWHGFNFRGHEFQVYQEFHNSNLMIRIHSKAPSYLRNQLKGEFVKRFSKLSEGQLDWDFSKKSSRWHQVAVLNREIKNQEVLSELCELFKSLDSISRKIVEEITLAENERGQVYTDDCFTAESTMKNLTCLI